ncbi:hypothetical protein Tco_0263796, partial [Tanacetum coccineum]
MALLVVYGRGDVIRNLLRCGRVSLGGGDGDDDEGDDGGEGDGGGEGEWVLLQGGEAISSTTAALIAGERVYDARTIFLGVNIKRNPLRWSQHGQNKGICPGWIIEV